MVWSRAMVVIGSNIISKVCAVVSLTTVFMPWLVIRSFQVHAPPGTLISIAAPEPYYLWNLIYGAFYGLPTIYEIAAIVFVGGAVLAWWSPAFGILQLCSIGAMVNHLVQNDFMAYQGSLLEIEVGLGLGFYVAMVSASVTILSLWPAARSTMIKAVRTIVGRTRPQIS